MQVQGSTKTQSTSWFGFGNIFNWGAPSDVTEGKMSTNNGTRTIQQWKEAKSKTLEKFFNNYPEPDKYDTAVINFLTNKLSSVAKTGKNVFDESHPLYRREDFLTNKINSLIRSFIEYATANGIALDRTDDISVIQRLLEVLKNADDSQKQVDISQSVIELKGHDIKYIIETLEKTLASLRSHQTTSANPSRLTRFKNAVVNLTPTREGIKNRVATISTSCSKYAPSREGIKKFFTIIGKPVASLVAIGSIGLAWVYKPEEMFMDVTRQNAEAFLDEYRGTVGTITGVLLTATGLAVLSLFSRCYRKAPAVVEAVKAD